MKMTRLELLLVLESIHTLMESGLTEEAKKLIEKIMKQCEKK